MAQQPMSQMHWEGMGPARRLFERDLRKFMRMTTKKAVQRTMFEVQDALAKHARRQFTFKAGTKRWMASGSQAKGFATFIFNVKNRGIGARGRLWVKDRTRKGKGNTPHDIYAEHSFSHTSTQTSGESERLKAPRKGKVGQKIAMPIQIRIGSQGKVRKGQTPGALIKANRAYVSRSGKTVMLRKGFRAAKTGKGVQGNMQVAYALLNNVKVKKRFFFERTAVPKAQQELPKKLMSEFDKARQLLGGALQRS